MRRALALIGAVALAAVLAGPVSAAGTISANGVPQYQQLTTFTITLTGTDAKYECDGHYNNGKCARVEVLCYQAGALVYGEAGGLDQAEYTGFQLGGASSLWVQNGGGPAECTANLFRFGNLQGQQTYFFIATTSFAAGG